MAMRFVDIRSGRKAMDFAYPYTKEQQLFRQEVRAWFKENIPYEMHLPTDRADFTEGQWQFWREKNKELAAKGWLYPTYPKEYGGGGLTGEHETILEEEFHNHHVPHLGVAYLLIPTLLVWGTEEQKQKFLVPLLKGDMIAWQKYTEPHSGSDLASYKSTAVLDGDEWILNGSSAFPSSHPTDESWYFGPMLTDTNAPRHRNLGFFLIPHPSPGLQVKRMHVVSGGDQSFVYLDNVRVPSDHLIGGDHDGWQVANTTLEEEHGGRGQAFPTDAVANNLVSYMRERHAAIDGQNANPVLQQTTMGAFVDAHVDSLFKKRTYWMYRNRMEMSWEGPSTFHWERVYGMRNVGRVRDVMGMHALLGTNEPAAPHGGAQEVYQRTSFIHQHGAGSFNITKVVLARRIGISRTKQRAAPTPATATSYSS
jgi:alkylation response protein AidB-like acyl-CoA dehydrogenase